MAFWVCLSSEPDMLELALTFFGLSLTIILGLWPLLPAWWPKLPTWTTLGGIALGILLLGVTIGLIIEDLRDSNVTDLKKPDLHLAVSGGNVFVPDGRPELTGVGLDARIWSTGAPSIATGWAMKITPNGGDAVVAQLTAMPNVLSATGPFHSAKLLAANSLETKTRDKQIGRRPVEGVLLL